MLQQLHFHLGRLDECVDPRNTAQLQHVKSDIYGTVYNAIHHNNTQIHHLQTQNHALNYQNWMQEQTHARVQREAADQKDGIIGLLRDQVEAKRADILVLEADNQELTEKCEALEAAAAADAVKNLVRKVFDNITRRDHQEQLQAMTQRAAAAEDKSEELQAKLDKAEAANKRTEDETTAVCIQLTKAQEELAELQAKFNTLLSETSAAKAPTSTKVDSTTQTCSTDTTAQLLHTSLPAINTHKLLVPARTASTEMPTTPDLPAAGDGGALASWASQAASRAVVGLRRTSSAGSNSSRGSSSPTHSHTQWSPTPPRNINTNTPYQPTQQPAGWQGQMSSGFSHPASSGRQINNQAGKGRSQRGRGASSGGSKGNGNFNGVFANSGQGSFLRGQSPRVFIPRGYDSMGCSSSRGGYRSGCKAGQPSSSCSYGGYDGF